MTEEYLEIHEQSAQYGKILFKEECFKLQGAIFEVYRELGCGFLESAYQESLERELNFQNIPFKSQIPLFISYKGERLTRFINQI